MQQLSGYEIQHGVQLLVEHIEVSVGLDREPRQVDRCEAEVSSAAYDCLRRVMAVCHYSGTASHVGNFLVVVAFLIELQVERSVQETEVREQPLCAASDGQLEEIVVRISLVEVDAFLDLEDRNREDRRLAVSESRLCGEQEVLDDHAAFRSRVGSEVDRAERHLSAGSRVHGVEVVDKSLHSLIGHLVRPCPCCLGGLSAASYQLLSCEPAGPSCPVEPLAQHFAVRTVRSQCRSRSLSFDLLGDRLRVRIRHVELRGDYLSQRREVFLDICPCDARRHRVVEVRYRLSAVHLVLVGLDRDACQ